MVKCVICERRPAKDNGYCPICDSKIVADRKSRRKATPRYFLTYRGNVVGLFSDGKGTLKARLLTRSADRLPKRNTIDLNRYCDGYSREQIKGFKACVLKLGNA